MIVQRPPPRPGARKSPAKAGLSRTMKAAVLAKERQPPTNSTPVAAATQPNRASAHVAAAVRREAEEDWGRADTRLRQSPARAAAF